MANTAINHDPVATFPGSSTNTAVVKWSGTSGNALLDSGVIIDGSNNVTGLNNVTATGYLHLTGDEKELRFYEGANYIAIAAPSGLGADYTFTLPLNDGAADEFLQTNGSGVLVWAAAAGTTINSNADNRVITGSGTANTLEGETNLTFDGNKLLLGNTTASTKITKGASFDMDGNADTVMEWRSTGRITHGMTGILDTNTFGAVQFVSGANSPNAGGLHFIGVSHANAGDKSGIGLTAVMRSGQGDNSHTLGQAGSPSGALLIQARQVSGTSWAALDAGENMIVVRNHTTTKYILDADGNTYQTGNVVIGTAGKGIDFAINQQSTATGVTAGSELLDWYEEGAFTPFLTGNSNTESGSTATYSYRTGRYVRIGRLVHCQLAFTCNSLGNLNGAHYAKVGGLPFTSSNVSGNYSSISVGYGSSLALPTAGDSLTGYVELNASHMALRHWTATGGVLVISITQISVNAQLMISFTYEVA